MHLAELLVLGARPGAGLLMSLTERCPLSCAHCSTGSAMDSPESAPEPFRRLVASFTPHDHPDAVLMSGGEPLLRPALVTELAIAARASGTRTAALSGMFFARAAGGVPPAVLRAAGSLDHFGASLDRHHEREVPRERVFTALGVLLDHVPAVSLHITSDAPRGGPRDDYVDGLVAAVRGRFGDRIPMLVSPVLATGRALALPVPPPAPRPAADPGSTPAAAPCPFAGWPLVAEDGTVYACTRQSLLRSAPPAHLVLGHAGRDSWRALRDTALGDPLLRSVRMLGPLLTRDRFGTPDGCADGCAACVRLTAREAGGAARYLAAPGGARLETAVRRLTTSAAPNRLAVARGALARYAGLTELGWERGGADG